MLLAGFITEICIGWPNRLFSLIGHPVSWLGKLISVCDSQLNRSKHSALQRKILGCVTLVVCMAVAGSVAFGVQQLIQTLNLGIIGSAILLGIASWPLLAARSLYTHVKAVIIPLQAQDLASARQTVAMIVGRNTAHLDEGGVSRAAAESLAENTSDGVVAPLFWGLVAGLPGLYIYKAVNTLDSMIGYKSEKYIDFGWASARWDDVVNLIPARLTGLFFCLFSSRPAQAFTVMIKDATKHPSPNAGWPEAALAGSIDIALSGPRHYEHSVVEAPFIHENGTAVDANKLAKCLHAYLMVMGGLALGLAGLACTAWI